MCFAHQFLLSHEEGRTVIAPQDHMYNLSYVWFFADLNVLNKTWRQSMSVRVGYISKLLIGSQHTSRQYVIVMVRNGLGFIPNLPSGGRLSCFIPTKTLP